MKIQISQIQYDPSIPVDPQIIDEIAEALKFDGQYHAIAVDPQNKLIFGRKRLLAAIKNGWQEIEASVIDKTEPLEVEECWLNENLHRHNLPWWERVELEQRLHVCRQERHGKGKQGHKVGWSLRDTAKELQVSLGGLSENILLADELQRNPGLRKIQDRATALRVVKSIVKRRQAETDSMEDIEFEWNQVYLGDSLQILKSFPNSIFEACITDPPWIEYKDENLTRDESTIEVFREVYRVLKRDSFLYAIMGLDDFFVYREKLKEFGFKVSKVPLMWIKEGILSHGRRDWEYARDYEPILLAVKGNPVLTSNQQKSAIMNYRPIAPSKLRHPHEKPKELINQIINDCTFEGARILDPFAGSGVVLESAKMLDRKFVGIERDKRTYDKIVGSTFI